MSLVNTIVYTAVAGAIEMHNNATDVPVHKTTAEAIERGVMLSAVPSLSMVMMSAFVTYVQVPELVQAAMQHLAAGVVFSAVVCELAPALIAAPKEQTWAIVVGFFIGVFGFLLLGAMMPEGDDDEDGESGDEDEPTEKSDDPSFGESIQKSFSRRRSILAQMRAAPAALRRTLSRGLSGGSPRPQGGLASSDGNKKEVVNPVQKTISTEGMSPENKASSDAIDTLAVSTSSYDASSEKTIQRSHSEKVEPFPLVFAVAVGVDAMVDGFLIGITSVSSHRLFHLLLVDYMDHLFSSLSSVVLCRNCKMHGKS
jgi:zinc transporter ZupT